MWWAVVTVLVGSVRPASADWTFGAFLGGARTHSSSLTLHLPAESTVLTLSPVSYDGESFELPLYYGYRVAYFPKSRWVGIEGELIHLKVVADTSRPTRVVETRAGVTVAETLPLSSVIDRFAISHGVNLLLVNAVVRRSIAAAPRWTVVGRMGAGASVPHPESTIGGLSYEAHEWGAMSLQGAVGIEMRARARVSVTGEYKLTRSVQDVAIAAGRAETPLVTHHFTVGLSFHAHRP